MRKSTKIQKNHSEHNYVDRYIKIEILKSAVAGIVSNGLDFLISGLILYADGHRHYDGFIGMLLGITKDGHLYSPPASVYFFATFLAFSVSFTVNYFLSVFYVFRYGHIGKRNFGILLFAIFAVLSMAITMIGSAVLHSVLGINVWVVKILMMLSIFALNLFVRRKYIFNLDAIRDDNTIHLPQNILEDDFR